jgi:hypothetical protein
MIPVEQTKLIYPDGNCFPACIASILEIPLDDVPCFHGENWLERYNEWLKDKNLCLINVLYLNAEGQPNVPPGYSILAADSPRGDYLHAVVCLNGEVVFDPHPQRDMGIREKREFSLFIVLDPRRATT